MRSLNFLMIILLAIHALMDTNKSTASECNYEQVATHIFQELLFNSTKGHFNKDSIEYFSHQESLIILLASIDSNHSNQLLVQLADYYLGDSINEVLSEAITTKKMEILHILEQARIQPSTCDNQKYSCKSKQTTINYYIDLIKKDETFQADEKPIRLLKKSEICKEFDKLTHIKSKKKQHKTKTSICTVRQIVSLNAPII